MLFTLSSSIATSKIFFSYSGIEGYALSSIYLSFSMLMPFVTFGIGAVATNLIAANVTTNRLAEIESKLIALFRLFLISSCFLILLCILFFKFSLWGLLLSKDIMSLPFSNLGLTLALILFCLTIPLTLAQSVLLANRKSHLIVAWQGLAGPAGLIIVWFSHKMHFASSFVALGPVAGNTIVAVFIWTTAVRLFPESSIVIARKSLNFKKFPGSSIRSMLGPMSIIVISLSLALQADRFILARFSSTLDFALYSLTAQLLSPTLSVMGVWATSLWPILIRTRSEGTPSFSLLKRFIIILSCSTVGMVLATFLISARLLQFVSSGTVMFQPEFYMLFSLVVLLQITHTIISYSLTTETDLRFQARNIGLMSLLNFLFSIIFTRAFGAYGPLFATLVTLLPMVIVPNLIRAKRVLA